MALTVFPLKRKPRGDLRMKGKRTVALVAVVAGMLACGVAAAKPPKDDDGFQTTVKPYAKGVPGSGWVTKPIFSVGDIVPETGTSNGQYRMVGIPGGLGVGKRGNGKGKRHLHGQKGKGRSTRVWMTHELTQTDVSEPRVGRPAHRGAFATELRLNRDGEAVWAGGAVD